MNKSAREGESSEMKRGKGDWISDWDSERMWDRESVWVRGGGVR